MSEYLITYDLKATDPSPYKEFVLAAEKEGLLYVYIVNDVLRLPNSTLWGEFETKEAARAAFSAALAAAGKKLGKSIVLEKRFITGITDIFVRSDVRKAPDRRWTGSTDFETCRKHQLNDPDFAY